MVTMANLMKDCRVLLTSTLYGLLGFVVIIADLVINIILWRSHDLFSIYVFPLLMVTGYDSGGYDMDDNEIGIFLGISSVFAILYQVRQLHS